MKSQRTKTQKKKKKARGKIRVLTDSKGRRYILINKKKIVLREKKGLTERELIKYILKNHVARRRRRQNKKAEKKKK